MTDRYRRALLAGIGTGVASASGVTLIGDARSGGAAERDQQPEFSVEEVLTGHYERDGDFEEKSEFEFSADPRTGFDVKFELAGVRPAPNDDVRLVHSVILSDIITGRLNVQSDSKIDEDAPGGSMEFVWHGIPAGVNRLFNTGNWMENTHSVYGVVTNAGDGGVVDSNFASIDPA